MARLDKYDSAIGGFRAVAVAVEIEANYGKPRGASLDAQGRVVVGAVGNSGYAGLVLRDRTTRKVGAVLDVITNAEIVECTGLAAGTVYYLDASGDLTATAPAAGVNGYRVGQTVEADRLVVRFQRVQG